MVFFPIFEMQITRCWSTMKNKFVAILVGFHDFENEKKKNKQTIMT